jgi:hypothetical protein
MKLLCDRIAAQIEFETSYTGLEDYYAERRRE